MCRPFKRLYALIPLRRVRARLLSTHIETCARCREYLETTAGLEASAAPPDWIAVEKSVWPAVRERIQTSSPGKARRSAASFRSGRRRTCALAATLAGALIFAVGIFVMRSARDARGFPRVSVVRAEANGEKAEKFFYQTREASYVWITGPEKKGGE